MTPTEIARSLTGARRYAGAIVAGYTAYALAVGVGIPHWQDWPTRQVPADAFDIGVLVFLAVRLLTAQPSKG